MVWIRCVRCEKLQRDFMARTFLLIEPVQYVLQQVSCSYESSQIHPNTTKRTETLVLGPMGWIGSVRCEKFWYDFIARTSVLIAPVQHVLYPVSCSNETLPNAPKHYETHQNMSLRSNGVDRVPSLRKIPMRLRGKNFCINCTGSARFAPSFVQ